MRSETMVMPVVVCIVHAVHSVIGHQETYEAPLSRDFPCFVRKVTFDFKVSPEMTQEELLDKRPRQHPKWTLIEAYDVNCDNDPNETRYLSKRIATKTIHIVKPFPRQQHNATYNAQYTLQKVNISSVLFFDWWTHTDKDDITWLDVYVVDRLLAFQVEVIWSFQTSWDGTPLDFSKYLPLYMQFSREISTRDVTIYHIDNEIRLFDVIQENPFLSYDGTNISLILEGLHKLNKSFGLYGYFPGESWESLVPKLTKLQCINVDPYIVYSGEDSVVLQCSLKQSTPPWNDLGVDYSPSLSLGMYYVPMLSCPIPENMFRWIKYIRKLNNTTGPDHYTVQYMAGVLIKNSSSVYFFYTILIITTQILNFSYINARLRSLTSLANFLSLIVIHLLSIGTCGYSHILATIHLFYQDWLHASILQHVMVVLWFLYPGFIATITTLPAVFYLSDVHHFGHFYYYYTDIPKKKTRMQFVQICEETEVITINQDLHRCLKNAIYPTAHLLISFYSLGTLFLFTILGFVPYCTVIYLLTVALILEILVYIVLNIGYIIVLQ